MYGALNLMVVLKKEGSTIGTPPSGRSVEELLNCGIAVIDKPRGPSSHEVSSFVRKILHSPKTGHAGTLDPNVSGVLPVLLGEACKLSAILSGSKKSYVCLMRLGRETPRGEIESVFENFRGKIYQKPPLQSAVAKRLRLREVYSLEILEVQGRDALFSVECEAGTYIRNICRDAREVLGCGAEMVELRRTSAIGFGEESCHTMQELSDFYWLYKNGDEKRLKKCILPVESAVKLKKAVVSDSAVARVSSGAPVRVEDVLELDEGIAKGDLVAVHSGRGQLFCIAKALLDAPVGIIPGKGELFAPVRVLKV